MNVMLESLDGFLSFHSLTNAQRWVIQLYLVHKLEQFVFLVIMWMASLIKGTSFLLKVSNGRLKLEAISSTETLKNTKNPSTLATTAVVHPIHVSSTIGVTFLTCSIASEVVESPRKLLMHVNCHDKMRGHLYNPCFLKSARSCSSVDCYPDS